MVDLRPQSGSLQLSAPFGLAANACSLIFELWNRDLQGQYPSPANSPTRAQVLVTTKGFDMERIRTSKRRRVDSHETASRSDSGSPDELSASPPHQQRNVSNGHYITPEPRRASYPDPDDSPDELGTVTPVYRPMKSESHGHQSARESPQRASRSSTATPQDLTSRDLTPRDLTPQDITPRDTTPVPSPLPPSPSPIPSPRKALYSPYAEKLVMKGHRRGVASVRFSPDGRMIASCCE